MTLQEFLNFAFQGFWYFIGCMLLIAMPLNFMFSFFNRFLRHLNIRKHGYPPEHCDADGDLPTYEETEEDTDKKD